MPKRSSKKQKQDDESQEPSAIAFDLVQQAMWEDDGGDGNKYLGSPPDEAPEPREPSRKNPAAVALGRLGGRKGGKARAKALTPEQRSEIAKKAADARWTKKG